MDDLVGSHLRKVTLPATPSEDGRPSAPKSYDLDLRSDPFWLKYGKEPFPNAIEGHELELKVLTSVVPSHPVVVGQSLLLDTLAGSACPRTCYAAGNMRFTRVPRWWMGTAFPLPPRLLMSPPAAHVPACCSRCGACLGAEVFCPCILPQPLS